MVIHYFDKKYQALTNKLLQQIAGEGLTVSEAKYVLKMAEAKLTDLTSEVEIQSILDSLKQRECTH